MANKKKSPTQKKVNNYIDLLYMTSNEVTAKDIVNQLKEIQVISTQLWEEMNIFEIELPSGSSIDFEPIELFTSNPSDAAFIRNRNIKTIFAINLCETDVSIAIPIFEKIIMELSGFICADSPDFQPVYAGSSNK